MSGTKGRDAFGAQLELLGFTPEYRFHPQRRWRWDWATTDGSQIACEYHGFVGARHGYGNVGHTSVTGMVRDAAKITEGQIMGWLVVVCNAKSVEDGSAMDQVIRALESRGREIA